MFFYCKLVGCVVLTGFAVFLLGFMAFGIYTIFHDEVFKKNSKNSESKNTEVE